jgi:hypothetical protein
MTYPKSTVPLIPFLLCCALLVGCAATRQASPEQRKPIVEIVEHSYEQGVAFDKAKRWAAQAFNSANDVIQEEDDERGTLVMKGIHRVNRAGVGIPVSYALTLDVRTEKMRLTFRPGEATNGSGLTEAGAEQLKELYFGSLKPEVVNAVESEDSFFN